MSTPTASAPLRVQCPFEGTRGPAVWVCLHLRIEGGPHWGIIPTSDGAWGFACPACRAALESVAAGAAGSGPGDPAREAAVDVAAKLLRVICRHCLEEAKGPRWMAIMGASADLMHNVHACGRCRDAEAVVVITARVDTPGGPGTLLVPLCADCDAGKVVGELLNLDPEHFRFIPDND